MRNMKKLIYDYCLLRCKDTLAEMLRRRLAKPMGSPRVGSNPIGVDCWITHRQHMCLIRALILPSNLKSTNITCAHNPRPGCSYTWPGLHWRPSAGEADVIAARHDHFLLSCIDTLAEWLRRQPAKTMGSPRVGSNPTGVDCWTTHRQHHPCLDSAIKIEIYQHHIRTQSSASMLIHLARIELATFSVWGWRHSQMLCL